MSKIEFRRDEYGIYNDGFCEVAIEDFNKFEIPEKSTDSLIPIEAVAAVFDLEGYTKFCQTPDFKTTVGRFQSRFLHWIIEELKRSSLKCEKVRDSEDVVELFCPPPRKVKFMGDGLLILWDVSVEEDSIKNQSVKTQDIKDRIKENIVYMCYLICEKYKDGLYEEMKTIHLANIPKRLRCGISQGQVYSIDEFNDYIGPCINMASRLEHLPRCTFAFDSTGFDVSKSSYSLFKEHFLIAKRSIRGVSALTPVAILCVEFEDMPPDEKKEYDILHWPSSYPKSAS